MKKILLYVVIASLMITTVFAAATPSLIGISLVNQDPDPALAGDIVELRLGIENSGGEPANNLVLELIPTYPFELMTGESAVQEVGTLSAYQQDADMRIVKYKVRIDKDATAGSYELKIKYSEDGVDTLFQRSLWVDVSSSDSAEIIYINQVELIPGKITPLTFTVNNVGSSPLRELSFQWENEDDIILPVGSDNTKYVKYIDVGEDAELSFDVIASANADPDLYKLDLLLTYQDPVTGEEKEIATKAGVYVGGATDFDVAFSGTTNGEYSFSIANIGSVAATSVLVRLPKQDGWRISGSDSVIIGNLNEGDYTIASFMLQQTVSKTTETPALGTSVPQSSPLLVDIVYTDSRGNRNTITKELSLSAAATMIGPDGLPMVPGSKRGMQEVQSSGLASFWEQAKWIIIAVVVFVVLFVMRKKYKRAKIDDSDYTLKQFFGLKHKKNKKK